MLNCNQEQFRKMEGTILFLGDSITDDAKYVTFVNLYASFLSQMPIVLFTTWVFPVKQCLGSAKKAIPFLVLAY